MIIVSSTRQSAREVDDGVNSTNGKNGLILCHGCSKMFVLLLDFTLFIPAYKAIFEEWKILVYLENRRCWKDSKKCWKRIHCWKLG